MGKKSAGILAWRRLRELEVLLVHPGGPFFARKDEGAWSIPKGEYEDNEEPLTAARREFEEELGMAVTCEFLPLTPIKQKGGKTVCAWAVEANIDVQEIRSNTFSIEWPPGSGKSREFPEVDKAAWFAIGEAREKMNVAQSALLDELVMLLSTK